MVAAWHACNVIGNINEVTLRRARLVLRWVTVSFHECTISLYDQSTRPTQPPTLSGMKKSVPAIGLSSSVAGK